MTKKHVPENFYTDGALDRAAHLRRGEGWLEDLLGRKGTAVLPLWRSKNLVSGLEGGPGDSGIGALFDAPHSNPQAVYLEGQAAAELCAAGGEIILLGLRGERAFIAVDISPVGAPETLAPLAGVLSSGETYFADLRAVGPLLDRRDGALFAYARGMMTWHRRHLFCGLCGAETVSHEAGHLRICGNEDCSTHHFPRTDPAVIMLVTDGTRCLLGRQAAWPPGMHSTLAGFVEPGESLEGAVAREVFEEAGIRVNNVHYHSSQPWPFPSSVMLGFHAEATSTEITVDESELEAAEWFEADWIRAHAGKDGFRLPRVDSIARRLVDGWLEGV
ncbi:MAG: NAD(+) diphosphatase [Alphaproteobacteria bacterium]